MSQQNLVLSTIKDSKYDLYNLLNLLTMKKSKWAIKYPNLSVGNVDS
jgi:hypothetical protein